MAEAAPCRSPSARRRSPRCHRALGARMVPFAGYAMPVQYPTGIIAEHNWTRDARRPVRRLAHGAGFLALTAPSGDADADHAAIAAVVEPLSPGDIAGLKPGQIRYTLLLNDDGGIIDDLMVTRPVDPAVGRHALLVVNAGTQGRSTSTSSAAAAGDRATLTRADDGAPARAAGPAGRGGAWRAACPAVAELGFMTARRRSTGRAAGSIVSRSGYTGEDGFEILVRRRSAEALWDALLAEREVKPIGLGARDSLRLEAGLPLRPRHRRDHVARRGGSRLRHLQAPPRGGRFPRRRAHPARARRRARRAAASASSRRQGARPRGRRDPRQRRPRHRHRHLRRLRRRRSMGRSPWAMSPPRAPRPARRSSLDGARQGARRHRGRRCPSFPTAIIRKSDRS